MSPGVMERTRPDIPSGGDARPRTCDTALSPARPIGTTNTGATSTVTRSVDGVAVVRPHVPLHHLGAMLAAGAAMWAGLITAVVAVI